ncbi:hypothetical protein F751_3278 [Auxenochlorella protothecoides]|uniref:Mediator of RNA polymerase II transcription subunit 17 n=1 Tax=Auxenochlorella protothecoides TaxID=3075 RepID=A0A087STZ3_AUXPR|nr:hypothetical protein F751_3278 [Auxenochlorella protothecoides]KFM29197.1 hypothetical protein F751_3278 [Auxenochlorella protothecoides]
MSFDMALPHTQRVQAILQDGLEVLPENQELWNLYRAAEPGIGRPRDEDDEVEDDPLLKPDQEQAKPITPQRVLDKLQDAKAELDVIVDVVGMVEAAQFLSVAHVPRRAAIQAMARDRALALAGKRGALRGAAARLRSAAAALRGPAAAEAEYLDQVRQLMGCWHLRRAANGLLGHTVELLPLHIFGEHTATITPSPDGQAGCGEARGLQAVRRELQRRQAAALWRSSCVLGSLQAVASKAQLAGSLGAALRGAVASEGVRSCLAARQDLSVVHEEGGWGGDPHVLHVCLGELEGSVAVDGRGVLLEGPLWPRDVQGRRHVGEAELRAILLQL